MSKHTDFIQSSMDYLLEDAVNALRGISDGISSYAVCDYIFHSLFLKMTGFSEQKAKCICWELATVDYEYRYEYLKAVSKYGEMSDLSSKNRVFNDIVKVISKSNQNFDPELTLDKVGFLADVKDVLQRVFKDTILFQNNNRHYVEFLESYDELFKQDYVVKVSNRNDKTYTIFSDDLKDAYDGLVRHRNRCAHNLMSYQQNLPSLRKITDAKYKYENYYIRFALLLIMDRCYVSLFNSFIGCG